jgi:hypothetical protein
MTCFEFRRLLMALPREKTAEQEMHMAQCERCARIAAGAVAFESWLEEAILVPVPEALAERVLLRQHMRPAPHYGVWAMAATLVIGVGLGVHLYQTNEHARDAVALPAALPGEHPAVAAISFVLDHEPQLLKENRTGDPQVMVAAFQRLGLKQPADGTTIRYLGKCPVPGGTGEHIVLTTPYGAVTLILVPDYPVGSRVLVADRQMTAVAQPVRNGGYIVVADSPQTIRQVERMLM